MSSLLTSAEVTSCTGIMRDMFDTFASQVIVFKEPIKTIVEPESENVTFGYGASQSEHTYSFTPVSGIYSGVFSRSKPAVSELEKQLNTQYAGTNTFIKVRQDCYDFIKSGTTDKIQVAGTNWKIVGNPKRKIFINDLYYVFNLEEIQ